MYTQRDENCPVQIQKYLVLEKKCVLTERSPATMEFLYIFTAIASFVSGFSFNEILSELRGKFLFKP